MENVRVNGLMGLEIERDLLLLTFVGQDCTDEENEAIRRDTVVQLETLLCGRDGRKHRESVDTRFDVGSSPVLLRQHSRDSGNLILLRGRPSAPLHTTSSDYNDAPLAG